MVSNYVLKDIPVTLAPSDKRFYLNVHHRTQNPAILPENVDDFTFLYINENTILVMKYPRKSVAQNNSCLVNTA